MQIDNANLRGKAPLMSAFGRKTRPFTEPIDATRDDVIGPDKTIPDLIRAYYPGATMTGFNGRFGFLDRDNKIRTYDPGKEDPFVFKNMASLEMFREEAKRLISLLCTMWEELGLPLVHDADRDIFVPDTAVAWEALKADHPLHKIVIDNVNAIYFIVANADIMKKACVIRTVNAGWWAVSYKGKSAASKDYFSTSLNAHRRAIKTILHSSKGKQVAAKLWATASDPLDTNPGYPFFSAIIDDKGNPKTRIETVELFKNIQSQAGRDWDQLLRLVNDRAGRYGMEGYPFCVAALRRQQPGRKWQHQFTITPSGMRTAYDEKGVNSQRVAWMVPYVYNLLLTPVQVLLKTVRMVLPGLYHDGESKLRRMQRLQTSSKTNKLWLAEADYSNYDRFIPVDIIDDIVTMITDETDSPRYWHQAAMYLHKNANLVWPDYSSVSDGNGWLFKPGELGLMSGVKATSEAGTLVNSVVNGEVLARTYDWSETQLYDYLTQYVDADAGSKFEYYYVQSDDTELISESPSNLYKQGEEFKRAVKAAGLKGDVEMADRFLMRHMQQGSDRPVPARVWQNTLSNEAPPPSEIIFLAGLAARTDGLLGIKTVDPFQTGELQQLTAVEAKFTLAMVESLHRFFTSAAVPSMSGINLLNIMLREKGAIDSLSLKDKFTSSPSVSLALGNIRRNISAALAKEQLESMAALGSPSSVLSWIYSIYKDKNIPSSALMLEQLIKLNGDIAHSIKTLQAKEEAFFKYASDRIGVKPLTI